MGSLAAIQMLVQDNFSELCHKENHGNRVKRVLRFRSCDTVCTRCNDDDEPTVKVFKFRNRNSVWLDDINEKVDCTLIQRGEADDGRELIGLKPNHREYHCEASSFCSLACKTESVMNQLGTLSTMDMMSLGVRKRRTGGRKKGEVGIFHRFYWMILATRRARSGGRRRRIFRAIVEGRNLPPKKRRNRGG